MITLTDQIIAAESTRRLALALKATINGDATFATRYADRIRALTHAALAKTSNEDRYLPISEYADKIIAPLLEPSKRVAAAKQASAR